jgi:tetratricopeptide (TPR) repeat protein
MASSNSGWFSKVLAVAVAGSLVSTSALPLSLAQGKPAKPAPAGKPAPAKPAAKPPAAKPEVKPAPAPKPAGAGATGPDQKTRDAARKAYSDGEKAYAAGEYAKAEENFKKADEILPSPHAEYWIAMSIDKQGRADDAAAAFEKLLANPDVAKLGDEKNEQVKARLAELKGKQVGELNIVTSPTGASVSVDGQAQAGETPMILKLAPGAHKITITNPGYEKQELSVDVAAGQRSEKNVELKPAELTPPATATPAPAAPAPAPPAEPAKPAEPRSKVPAYVTLGIAGAGALVGTYFGIQALSAKKDFNDDPTTDNADKVERNALIADMAFGVAITLGVTGVVLLTSSDSAEAPKEKAMKRKALRNAFHVAPVLGPTGGGAAARFTF